MVTATAAITQAILLAPSPGDLEWNQDHVWIASFPDHIVNYSCRWWCVSAS